MKGSKYYTNKKIDAWCDCPEIVGQVNYTYDSKYSLQVVGFLAPSAGEIILDNGCGNGRFSQILSGDGRIVVSLDINPFMVGSTKSRGIEGVNGVIADSQNLPFVTSVFDKAMCVHNMWYIPLYDKSVVDMLRIVKLGGRMVLDQISEKWDTRDIPILYRILWKLRSLVNMVVFLVMEKRGFGRNMPCFYRTSHQLLHPFGGYNPEFHHIPLLSVLYHILDISPMTRMIMRDRLQSTELVKGFSSSVHRWLVVCDK